MKQIVYTASDSGIDGREPERVVYASFDEAQRDALIESDKSKAWRQKGERIIDMEHAVASALAKLDGIDRLALRLPPWPSLTLD